MRTGWGSGFNVPVPGSAVPVSERGTGTWNPEPTMRCVRRVISSAARRVKVRSKMRSGRAPDSTRCATRCASVFVLPVPAPAIISNGPEPNWAASCCLLFNVSSEDARVTGVTIPRLSLRLRVPLRRNPALVDRRLRDWKNVVGQHSFNPAVFQSTNSEAQSSRSATGIGRRAALIAGNSPPINPISNA